MSQEIPAPPEKDVRSMANNPFRREEVSSYPASAGSPATGSMGTPKGADENGRPVSGPLGKNPSPPESSFR